MLSDDIKNSFDEVFTQDKSFDKRDWLYYSLKRLLKNCIIPQVEQLEQREKELIEYIKLLKGELDDMSGICFVHGWKSTRVEEGKNKRKKLEELFNKTWEEIIKE